MEKLIKMITRHEGERSHVYKCSVGMETIGIGRAIGAGGLGLSDDEISMLLANDVNRVIDELSASFPWFLELDEVRRDAIIDICFNLGITKLLNFKNALNAMDIEDYKSASMHFYDSRWAKQVGDRADELCEMIRTGEYRTCH